MKIRGLVNVTSPKKEASYIGDSIMRRLEEMSTFLLELPSFQDVEAVYDYVMELLEKYESLGPLPGIFLPFIEAFLPFLPLFVFVMANSAAYGLLKGFILSWLGASLGSVGVFLAIRKLSNRKFVMKIKNNKQVDKVTKWVEERGFSLLFILLCFPFAPSAVINVVAALSNISLRRFMLAVFLGKSVMIFSLAYIGVSVFEFTKNPVKTTIIVICIVIFWFFGKFIEKLFFNGKKSQGDE